MKTLISDILDVDELQRCLADGRVVARRHPTAPLTILNYSPRCQYEHGLWTPTTLACRGLIHNDHGQVLARPFSKFFNYGQLGAPAMTLATEIIATDKLDGSLGILYPLGDSWAIATRGSFDSEQADHATRLWHHRYADVRPPDGYTWLFEIVYPKNRIVLDYGDLDDLIFLGEVVIETGATSSSDTRWTDRPWPGPRATIFEYVTLEEALRASPRPNAEGMVLHLPFTDERVKIKQADYVALHRIVSMLHERTVWEHLASGKQIEALLNGLPDEFHTWAREVAARLLATVESVAAEVERAYSIILALLPAGYTRKDFALCAQHCPWQAGVHALFQRHDGKDYRRDIWKSIRPSGRSGPRGLVPSDDTA